MPFVSRETFFWGQRVVVAGQTVDDSDPVLVKHRSLFVEVASPVVEQATASPGERRAVRNPRKKEP